MGAREVPMMTYAELVAGTNVCAYVI